jgi:hypothetical protein
LTRGGCHSLEKAQIAPAHQVKAARNCTPHPIAKVITRVIPIRPYAIFSKEFHGNRAIREAGQPTVQSLKDVRISRPAGIRRKQLGIDPTGSVDMVQTVQTFDPLRQSLSISEDVREQSCRMQEARSGAAEL